MGYLYHLGLGNRKRERDFQVERWDFDFGGKHLK